MSTMTAETVPIYGREQDWFEALSMTDEESWSRRSTGRRILALTSSTARVAEDDILWALSAPSFDFPWSNDITWTPEIRSPDLTAHVLAGVLSGRVATRHIIVNLGNVTLFRRHLEERTVPPVRTEVVSRIQELFLRAEGELAETGSADNFGLRLQSIIRAEGVPAVNALTQAIQSRGIRDSLVFEALRRLGALEHPPSYRRRFDLLVEGLNSPSPIVRDGAGLGLAFLDDPTAMPHLEQAIRKERVRELKDDLQLVLDQLVETARSVTST